ncbi:SEC-C metal-binding domain-containing protein [uncultured Desulfobulbus sp.]|uniref:SEC-C metal-binding domain-containing protein n=1 Tax=uncultured Desulfobulbus sp. TaxID=239745 RepID=UPI0029C74AF3|nr:SEC-C metal-binding domain-containing protein [uncultured Desulfobulbus sp.]
MNSSVSVDALKVNRNDPCPCGSGIKFKKCCMDKKNLDPLQDLKEDIHNLIGGQQFGSMEELQAVLSDFNRQKNSTPIEDFHGLSSEQMHRFLHFPFESPDLVRYSDQIATEPESKAALLLSSLVERIGEDGVKLTAKKNLSLKLCQEIAARYLEHYDDRYLPSIKIRSEEHFEGLNAIRLTAQLGGLFRVTKGRLFLTNKCNKAFDSGGMKKLYPLLFNAYTRKFNWGFLDGYESLGIIQQSFLFTLYLLHIYGTDWRPAAHYADCFIQAFPLSLKDVEEKINEKPEETFRRIYILRSLERFADFFGLVELKSVSDTPYKREYQVRATGLLDALLRFEIGSAIQFSR